MENIVLIEDNHADFSKVKDLLTESKFHWKVYPEFEHKDLKLQEEINNFFLSDLTPKDGSREKRNAVKSKIEKYLMLNDFYKDISLIILDLELFEKTNKPEESTGAEIISIIRNLKTNDSEYEDWGTIVPICVLTNFDKSDDLYKELFFSDYKVNDFMKKSLIDPNTNYQVYASLNKCISFFNTDLKNLKLKNTKVIDNEQYNELRKQNNQTQELITRFGFDQIYQFQNLLELIKKNEEKSNNTNSLIISLILQILSFDDLERILDTANYEKELLTRIGEDKFTDLKRIKYKKQDKEKLINLIEDISGIIDKFPLGINIIGILPKILKLIINQL